MLFDRRTILTSAASLLTPPIMGARKSERETLRLAHGIWPPRERFAIWPGTPPGAPLTLPESRWQIGTFRGHRELWIQGVSVPEVSVFRPADPDGSALLVCPGGAYLLVSVENAGMDLANFLVKRRTTVFLLTYRLPWEGWTPRELTPLSDAQRAMRVIRSRASEFRIDPAKLGIFGSSAGGQLAADLGVSHDIAAYKPVDAADRLSARPAFIALLYPVTTLELGKGHAGTRENLLGTSPSADLLKARSPALHIAPGMPPCFIAHAMDDEAVPVEDSIAWVSSCRAAGVPLEAHFFEQGRHGFGSYLPRSNPASRWRELLSLWMQFRVGR